MLFSYRIPVIVHISKEMQYKSVKLIVNQKHKKERQTKRVVGFNTMNVIIWFVFGAYLGYYKRKRI